MSAALAIHKAVAASISTSRVQKGKSIARERGKELDILHAESLMSCLTPPAGNLKKP